MPVVLCKKSGKLQAHAGLATARGPQGSRGGGTPLTENLANFTTNLCHFLIAGTNFWKYKVM